MTDTKIKKNTHHCKNNTLYTIYILHFINMRRLMFQVEQISDIKSISKAERNIFSFFQTISFKNFNYLGKTLFYHIGIWYFL